MMSELSTLIELQTIYDYLNTIQRDLSNLPPDLDKINVTIIAIQKNSNEVCNQIEKKKSELCILNQSLIEANKNEDDAKIALKKSTQKVQYFSNIRKLDEYQKHRINIERRFKSIEKDLIELEQTYLNLTIKQTELKKTFDKLKDSFLLDHTNQIEARSRLEDRRSVLEKLLSNTLLVKFNRLIKQRMGQAVVKVEDGVCCGCRTRLRQPLISELRESNVTFCESCQRIIYIK